MRWDSGGEFGRVDWRTIDLPPYVQMQIQIQRAQGVIQMIQMQIQGVIQMMFENMGGAGQKPLAADLTPGSQGIFENLRKDFDAVETKIPSLENEFRCFCN